MLNKHALRQLSDKEILEICTHSTYIYSLRSNIYGTSWWWKTWPWRQQFSLIGTGARIIALARPLSRIYVGPIDGHGRIYQVWYTKWSKSTICIPFTGVRR